MSIPGPSGNFPSLQPVVSGLPYNGAELVVDLIEAQIKGSIVTALENLRSYYADPIVTTEPPREYFQYEMAEGYRLPAVFTIIQDLDLREESEQPNHVNSADRVIVAVVVEDRVKRLVVKKAWRYQAAMMQCLHHVSLTSADGTLRIFSRVKRCSFSGIISLTDKNSPSGVFRQEMSLQLQIDHIEPLR